jgi:glyoxylase-like metal-dependent hydrolase (beta-lactamase superfamily II)
MTQVKLTIRSSGHCFAEGHHVMKGAPKKPVRFEAIWAEIDHPTQGKVLFDTGYTWRFLEATKRFPQRIYAELTKVSILPEEEAHRQVDPAQVKHLICSHIHADHVGGLRDFPDATCWASQECLAQFDRLPHWRSWARGVLKPLFPDNWRETCLTFESTPQVSHDILGKGCDLFDDGSVVLFPLPGHAAGQHGALVQTSEGPVLLVADAFWDIRAVTEGRVPNPIVRVFFEDMDAYAQTLVMLKRFYESHPNVPLIATHCPEAAKRITPYSVRG